MDRLLIGARKLGIELSPGQLAAFDLYRRELQEWNRLMNLTAIDSHDGILVRHFLDSLSCVPTLREAWTTQPRLIDVGAGAGFPGVPLKIVCPALQLTLLEATGKKADFLRHLCDRLELEGGDSHPRPGGDLGPEPAASRALRLGGGPRRGRTPYSGGIPLAAGARGRPLPGPERGKSARRGAQRRRSH